MSTKPDIIHRISNIPLHFVPENSYPCSCTKWLFMKRDFIVNIIFLVFINILIKPIYIFGIDRTIQNTVGTVDFGIYTLLFNFTVLFQIINDLGIQNYNNRNIAQDNQLMGKYFSNIIVLKTGLAFIFLTVVFFTAWVYNWEKYFHLLIFVAINQILVSLILYLRSNISGLGMYRTDSLLSITDKLLMIIVCGILLWTNPFEQTFQIEWLIYAQTFTWLISVLLAIGILYPRLPRLKLKINFPFLLLVLKRSYPYALIVLLMTIYTRIDFVMIGQMLSDGENEAGIYAAAYRLLDATNMLGALFAGLLLPMFSKMIKHKENIGSMLNLSLRLIWAASVALSITVFFFRLEIMDLLYTESTPYWGEVLGNLIMSFVAVSLMYILGALLTAKGRLRPMNLLFLGGVIFNICLNYCLISSHKAAGAALATSLTQWGIMLGLALLTKKTFTISAKGKWLFQLIIYAISIFFINFFFYKYVDFDWKVEIMLVFASAFFAAIALKLISFGNLFHLIKNK